MRYLCLLLLAVACTRPSSPVPASTANPTSYLLARETWFLQDSVGWAYVYNYDSATHLVTSAEQLNFNSWSCDTTLYTFSYEQGRAVRISYSGGHVDYQYGGNGRVSRVITVSDPADTVSDVSYLIDQAERIDEVRFTGAPYDIRYTYDNQGDMTSCGSTQFTSYDAGVNYAKTINGLPEQIDGASHWDVFSSTEPHNPLVLKLFGHDSTVAGYPIVSLGEVQYAYTYNDAGLPLTRDDGTDHVVFDYVKYR